MRLFLFFIIFTVLSACAAAKPSGSLSANQACARETVSFTVQTLAHLPKSAVLSIAGSSAGQFEQKFAAILFVYGEVEANG